MAQDFSKEVSYTVTAEDASTVVYKVNVAVPVTGTLDNIFAFPNEDFNGISYFNYLNGNTNVTNIKMGTSSVENAIVSKNYILSAISGIIQTYDFKNQKFKWTSTSKGSGLAIDEGKGLIFQGSNGSGAFTPNFYALDIETGNVKWTFKSPLTGNKILSLFYPVVGNGIVTATTRDSLYILNEDTGKIKWQFRTGLNSSYNVEAPVVVNDLVITNVYIGNNSQLIAYDLNTGKQVWSKNYNASRMKVGDNGILCYTKNNVSPSFNFAAIDTKNGNELWTSTINSSGFEFEIGNGLVVVNSATANYSGIVGLDAKTGAKLWEVFNDVKYISNFIITDKDIFFLHNDIIAAINKGSTLKLG